MSIISNNQPFKVISFSGSKSVNYAPKIERQDKEKSDKFSLFETESPSIIEREKHISDYEKGEGYRSKQIGDKIARNKLQTIFDLNPDDLVAFSGYQTALGYEGQVNLSEATHSVMKAVKKLC